MGATGIRYIVMGQDYLSALILILILLSCAWEKSKTALLKLYMAMAAACAISVLLEAVSLTAAFADSGNPMLRMVLNNCSIIGGYALSFFFACYVANLVGAQRRLCRHVIGMLQGTGLLFAAGFVLGSFLELFYTIENGTLVPKALFVLAFAYDVLACGAGIVLIILGRNYLNKRDVVALLTLPLFIFIFAILQMAVLKMMYGLFLMASVSLFIIYLMIQMERSRISLLREKQLMDMNIAMMRSQIQPHFLYNSLSSIRRMIKKDPEVAERAVENFALYLRQNLESMNRTEPIPFATELKHVEQYLYLEQLRFGERLQVEYDIGFSQFVLPVLSLQPLVENAAKHGVLKREEGGKIQIKTCREGDCVILTVQDDGVGYDPAALHGSDRLHIGFENVKRRIEMQCSGTVTVDSQIGVGTKVTMTIPLL